jgi:DNA-binding CsgD family transcriptional regulator/PAS domain-containing protein
VTLRHGSEEMQTLVVSAVEAIYAAAAAPSLWPAALDAIAQVFGDIGTVLLWRRDDGSYGTIASPALARAQEDYEAQWWREDIRSARAAERGYLKGSKGITDRDVVTEEELATHPIYTQFLVPHGLGWFAAARISPDPLIDVWISVQRARARAPYSESELDLVTRLASHAEKALRLSMRLLDAESANVGLGLALTRLGVGVFALDSLGRVVFSNPAAHNLRGDGIEVRDARLTIPASLSKQQAVQRAVGASLKGTAAGFLISPEPILISRPPPAKPLIVYVLPIPASGHAAQQFLTNVRAIVLVVDPKPDDPADPAVVRDLLGLTLGEARVAALVGSGLRPREAAIRLGIAEETARTVLKTVFSKVGVSRQTELAALLTKMVLR